MINYICVNVKQESGYQQALEGLALNKNKNPNDMGPVAIRLSSLDHGHNKFLESIVLWLEVIAPRYWWQEADTYRLSTKQSQSTMHTILNSPLDRSNFEDHSVSDDLLNELNSIRSSNLPKKEKLLIIKRKLPEGFLQSRLWCINYKTLRNIIIQRSKHILPHWAMFINSVMAQIEHPELLESVL